MLANHRVCIHIINNYFTSLQARIKAFCQFTAWCQAIHSQIVHVNSVHFSGVLGVERIFVTYLRKSRRVGTRTHHDNLDFSDSSHATKTINTLVCNQKLIFSIFAYKYHHDLGFLSGLPPFAGAYLASGACFTGSGSSTFRFAMMAVVTFFLGITFISWRFWADCRLGSKPNYFLRGDSGLKCKFFQLGYSAFSLNRTA